MSRVRYSTSFLACCALLLLALSACGGGGGGGAKPASADAAEGDSHSSSATASDDESQSDEAEESAPKRNSCDDGTCSVCGNSMCPSGWYCDESAKGGPACGWVPECLSKLSCGCLTKKFSSCSCEEKSGGVHLSCG